LTVVLIIFAAKFWHNTMHKPGVYTLLAIVHFCCSFTL